MRAGLRPGARQAGAGRVERLGDAEVREKQAPVGVEEQVRGLQVAVDDRRRAAVQARERGGDFAGEPEHGALGQLAGRAGGLVAERVLQREGNPRGLRVLRMRTILRELRVRCGQRAHDGFRGGGGEAEPPRADEPHLRGGEQVRVHDEVGEARLRDLPRSMDADDSRRLPEGGERAGLGGEAGAERGVAGAFGKEELHRPVDAERLVVIEPHLAHPAAAERPDGVKRPDRLGAQAHRGRIGSGVGASEHACGFW